MLSDTDVDDHYNPTIRSLDVEKNGSASSCGFHLTRSKWDPYPWVSGVDASSAAAAAGMQPGDCLLEVNGEDVVGQRISDIADLVKSNTKQVSLLLWNAGANRQCRPESLCCGPMPANLQKLCAVVTTILAFLECPICLETITPPTYQCDNGHLICIRCRAKSERCPVCRQRFSRSRSLIADQVFNSIIEAFNLKGESDETKCAKIQQIFKLKAKRNNVPDIRITASNSPHMNKFLSRIIGGGKSSSVENLTTSTIDAIRTKSLSTNEIFQSEPIVSRSGSMSRLKTKCLNVDSGDNRPASYHGSFESLNRKLDDIMQMSGEMNGLVFHCPFSSKCATLIKGNNFIDHFQTSHSGPLIQYFKPNFKLNLKGLLSEDETEHTYMVYGDMSVFFLKVHLQVADNGVLDHILMWTWYLGTKRTSKVNEMIVELKNQCDDLLLSVRSSIFSLNTVTFQEIRDNKKGVYISSKTIHILNSKSDDNVLHVNIITENE